MKNITWLSRRGVATLSLTLLLGSALTWSADYEVLPGEEGPSRLMLTVFLLSLLSGDLGEL